MAFDQSYNFFYTGQTEYWTKEKEVSSVLFILKGAGGGGGIGSSGGNISTSMGGGGAYVFAKYDYLNPDISYNISVNVGSGGNAPPIKTGGKSIGGQDIIGIGYESNAGDGTTLNNLESGGGGGLTSVNYVDPCGNVIIKTIAGGGGGAGSINGANGGNGAKIGITGLGTGGGQGGNTNLTGNPGIGNENISSNGYQYIDSSNNGLYTYLGGGGGNGGSFAGGGGGAGYGGGAGGNKGGGGGGGSYALLSSRNLFETGGGGAGGLPGQAGGNGEIQILWNTNIIYRPPFVRMYMLNSQHNSKSVYYAPTIKPSLANPTYLTDSQTFPHSPVISTDKELYIISGQGILYAFDHIFDYRWEYSGLENYKFTGMPAIANNGTLYVSSETTTNQNYLFAIIDINIGNNVLAVIKWKFELDGNSSVSPIMDLSGNIYVGTNNGSIYAIKDNSINGVLLWKYSSGADESVNGVPVFNISHNKICYTTKKTTIPISSKIYVIDLSNNINNPPTLLFTKTVNSDEYYQTPSINNQDHIYVSTTYNTIYSYDISNNIGSTLNELWNLPIDDVNLSSIAIDNNSNHILFTSKKSLNIVDGSYGTIDWIYNIDSSIPSVFNNSIPTIDASDNVYFGSYNTYLYSINHITRKFNWKYQTGGAIECMPVIDSTSHIYLGANDGKIYNFGGDGPIIPVVYPIVPMYMLNPQHTGISPYVGPSTLPVTLWNTDFVSGNLFVSPSISIASNGTLYLGSNDGYVYALSPTNPANNHVIWKKRVINVAQYPDTSQLYTTPVISSDGTIYIGSNEGYLYALNPDSTIKWSYYAGHPLQSSPIIDNSNNTIYFGAGYSVYAIGDAEYRGYPKWLSPFNTNGRVYSSPAIGYTGKLYFGSDDGYVYAVDKFTGLYEWSFNASTTLPVGVHPIYTSPTVDLSNNVIIGNGSYMNGVLYCFDGDTGNELWNKGYDPDIGPFYNAVAVYGDTIYLSTIAYVYAINRVTGDEKYKFSRSNYYYTSPIIDNNGKLFFASLNAYTNNGILHSLTDNGAQFIQNWSYNVSPGRLSPPVIGSDGTIYISSTANKIYAIQ
jgi:outer membrane protein assembly factor BamB